MQLILPLTFVSTPAIEHLYLERSILENGRITAASQAGYRHDWRRFSAWCGKMQRACFPATPETLSLFLTDLLDGGLKVSSVCRYAAGVAYYHTSHGSDSPLTTYVRALLRGAQQIRREQPRQMRPITILQLRAISAALTEQGSTRALRDLAIVIVGFSSALRRSNLAWLLLEDIRFCAQGLTIQVRREKNDSAGKGREIAIPTGQSRETCAVRCLEAWLAMRGGHAGPVFTRLDNAAGPCDALSPNAIWKIVKAAAGTVVAGTSGFGPHSLRAGMITEAGQAGVNHLLIAKQSGHRSLDSLQRYFRPADLFKANACALLGL